MSVRDVEFGVGIYRDDVATESIDVAQADVLAKTRVLAWELYSRSSDEQLSDAEVDLLNAISVLEGYKIHPWAGLRC